MTAGWLDHIEVADDEVRLKALFIIRGRNGLEYCFYTAERKTKKEGYKSWGGLRLESGAR